jgi:hypothetical protein
MAAVHVAFGTELPESLEIVGPGGADKKLQCLKSEVQSPEADVRRWGLRVGRCAVWPQAARMTGVRASTIGKAEIAGVGAGFGFDLRPLEAYKKGLL